jgi:xylan 1,4-beta-xylosidase
VDGLHATVDAWVIPHGKKLTVMLTNHALPRHSIATEQVRVRFADAARPRAVSVERIDETHANPRRVWRTMKEPNYLSPAHVEKLQEASRTAPEPHPWKYQKRMVEMEIQLPPHSVAAITVEFA